MHCTLHSRCASDSCPQVQMFYRPGIRRGCPRCLTYRKDYIHRRHISQSVTTPSRTSSNDTRSEVHQPSKLARASSAESSGGITAMEASEACRFCRPSWQQPPLHVAARPGCSGHRLMQIAHRSPPYRHRDRAFHTGVQRCQFGEFFDRSEVRIGHSAVPVCTNTDCAALSRGQCGEGVS